MLYQPVTDEIRRIIERGSQRVSQEMLNDLKSAAMMYKPTHDYDSLITGIRHRYDGAGAQYIKQAINRRYPSSGDRMPILPFNFIQRVAEVDASVYDWPPTREVFYRGEPDGQRQAELDDMLSRARIDPIMVEAERRVAVAKTVFFRIGWDPVRDAVNLGLYWPSDVLVIPHWSRPSDLSTAICVMAKVKSPKGDRKGWWEVWTRPAEAELDSMGMPVLGPISVELVSEDGESMLPFGSEDALYEESLPMPWVAFHSAMPHGSPFANADRDLPTITDEINVGWANLLLTADYQAHDEVVYKTNRDVAGLIAAGPGQAHKIGVDEDLQVLTHSADMAAQFNILDRATKTLAVTRGQPEDAYSTDGGQVLSGVSRKIKNLPATKRRIQQSWFAVFFEETALLPGMAAVSDLYGQTSILDDDAEVSFRVTVNDEPELEDPAAKQRRVLELKDLSLISDAETMVELGYFGSLSDAVAAGYSPDRMATAVIQPGGLAQQTLSQRLASRASPLTSAEDRQQITDPNEYRARFGRCPAGYRFDETTQSCVPSGS